VDRLTGRSAVTEDLVHEAFLLAFDRLAGGEEFTGDPGKWLRGTARNLVYRWWREKRGLPEAVVENLRKIAEESEQGLETPEVETQAALARCLEKLSRDQRDLVESRYGRGLRITQIAQEIRMNVSTLRVHLFRIRQRLKTCVERELVRGSAT